jgi:hypothetical protein
MPGVAPDFWACPSMLDKLNLLLLLLAVAFIVVVSALMFPVGAMQASSPWRDALSTFVMGFKYFPQSFPIFILVGALNMIISYPDSFFKQSAGRALLPTDQTLMINILLLTWQAATGLILLPASVLPFCELWQATKHESS